MSTAPSFGSFAIPLGGVGLEPWPITSEELDGSEMFGRLFWRSSDNTRAIGVWHATPGTIRGTFLADEVSYIAEGSLTVITAHDGADRLVRAGEVIVMTAGLTVEWQIHEPVTKLWNVHSAEGLPF